MGNCLKTQLKSIVNNDNLLKPGENAFYNTSSSTIEINYTGAVLEREVRLLSGSATFNGSDVTVAGTKSTSQYISVQLSPNSSVAIMNRYDATTTRISDSYADMKPFEDRYKYMTNVTSLNAKGTGDISGFIGSNAIDSMIIYGEQIQGIPNILPLLKENCTALFITDDLVVEDFNIALLGQCKVLTTLRCHETCRGSIEDLVAAFVDDGGRATGSIEINNPSYCTKITFGGEYLPELAAEHPRTTPTFSWTSKDNITVAWA